MRAEREHKVYAARDWLVHGLTNSPNGRPTPTAFEGAQLAIRRAERLEAGVVEFISAQSLPNRLIFTDALALIIDVIDSNAVAELWTLVQLGRISIGLEQGSLAERYITKATPRLLLWQNKKLDSTLHSTCLRLAQVAASHEDPLPLEQYAEMMMRATAVATHSQAFGSTSRRLVPIVAALVAKRAKRSSLEEGLKKYGGLFNPMMYSGLSSGNLEDTPDTVAELMVSELQHYGLDIAKTLRASSFRKNPNLEISSGESVGMLRASGISDEVSQELHDFAGV